MLVGNGVDQSTHYLASTPLRCILQTAKTRGDWKRLVVYSYLGWSGLVLEVGDVDGCGKQFLRPRS